MIEETSKRNSGLSELAEPRLFVSFFLMISKIILHCFKAAVLALDGNMLLFFMIFLFSLSNHFPALTLVHMSDAVCLMKHELRLLDLLVAIRANFSFYLCFSHFEIL